MSSSSFEYFLPCSPLRFRVPTLFLSHFFSPLLTTHWNHFETSIDFATCPASALPFNATPGPEVTTSMTGLWQRSTRPREPRPRTAFKASILINDRDARGKSKWKLRDDPWTFTGDFSSLRRIDVPSDARTWTVSIVFLQSLRYWWAMKLLTSGHRSDVLQKNKYRQNYANSHVRELTYSQFSFVSPWTYDCRWISKPVREIPFPTTC